MTTKAKTILEIIVASATVIAMCIGAIALIPAFGQWLFPISPIPTATNSNFTKTPGVQLTATTFLYPTNTLLPTSTLLPIDTPFPTIQPTATIIPESPMPIISLPFTDDFNSGINNFWTVVNGNWITVNGRLTIAFDNYGNKWIALEDPQMQNYRLSANLNRSAGQIEIAVRVQSSQSKLLVYNFGFYGHHCWAFDDGSYTNCIAGELGDLPEQMNIQMTVNGSNFSTLVDGRQTQSISMTDYSKGWIEIGIWCQNGFECPSIDNFKLDALP